MDQIPHQLLTSIQQPLQDTIASLKLELQAANREISDGASQAKELIRKCQDQESFLSQLQTKVHHRQQQQQEEGSVPEPTEDLNLEDLVLVISQELSESRQAQNQIQEMNHYQIQICLNSQVFLYF